MKRIGVNIFSQMASSGFGLMLGIVMVPIYVRTMGIEGYGLVGIFTLFQGFSVLLDFGIATGICRHLSVVNLENQKEKAERFYSFEKIYLTAGGILGLTVIILAPLIARYWVRSDIYEGWQLVWVLCGMGLALALQWPLVFYGQALIGLNRQKTYAVLTILFSIVRQAGAGLILWLCSGNPLVFFLWTGSAAGLCWWMMRGICVNHLGDCVLDRGIFQKTISDHWRFGKGMTLLVLIGVAWTNMDRIIISNVVSLKEFGYYSVAYTLANGLAVASYSIKNAFFPMLSNAAIEKDRLRLFKTIQSYEQVVACCLFPLASIFLFFGPEIMELWVKNKEVGVQGGQVLGVLAWGMVFYSLSGLYFSVELAGGKTRISTMIYAWLLPVLLVALFFLTKYFGVRGGAWSWLFLNLIAFIFMEWKISETIQKHVCQWRKLGCLFLSLGVALLGAWGAHAVYKPPQNIAMISLQLGVAYIAILSLLLASIKEAREYGVGFLKGCFR